ncbi:CYTL1 domain-containing protein [Alosa sapidissima]|uniref:CYTL1 domain-containing protein n=1 Tax=Alosa sapidissima TaxID=34773 RepID=UPI001C0A33B5|nr:CYTL1 domain-containing protein [Alosa sapidissima]
MASTGNCLIFLIIVSFVQGSPPPYWTSPPTCYSKVLDMGRDVSARVADLKTDPETSRCADHMPYLYIDVHNACIMETMLSFMTMIERMRQRRCAYTRKVQELRMKLRQLHMIISQRCHGDLVFTIDNCAALERRRTS